MTDYISVNEVLERVAVMLPENALQTEVQRAECLLLVEDGMRKIGAINTNIKGIINLKLEEYQVKVPEVVEDIIGIYYKDIPLNKVDIINNKYHKYVYTLDNGYIVSDLKEEELNVIVSVLPIDNNGEPLIPNKQYMISAIVAYLTERVLLKLLYKNKISDRIYERAKQEWLFYSGQARTTSLLPRQDEWNKLGNTLLKTFPKFHRGVKESKLQELPVMQLTDLNNLVLGQYNR